MAKSKVAVLRTSPQAVLDDYQRLCELADMKGALDPSTTTILKDNISWHLLYPSANTTPWQLEGTILALRNAGFADLVDVHNKTVVTIADLGDRYNKFGPVLEKHGIPKLYNFEPDDMAWIEYKPKARMLVLDRIYPDGIYIPDFFVGKNIVHLPTVKAHTYTVTTGAMKNAFGGLLNVNRHYTHTWIHDTLVDLLQIQKEIHTGIFATMDGTTAGSGAGPRTMIPHQKDVILASADQVAIDAVSAAMMGFEPLKIQYIARATELGLGQGDLRQIEIVGMPEVAQERWGFTVGANLGTGVGMLLWRTPLKVFQRLLFRTPIVNIFIFASEYYHDHFWYPLKGRKVTEEWLRSSPWGQLFQQYPD
ncbi:MAG: iron-sulfur cluster-binding protein [Anaerolineae bacterium SM23_84]|nr:MAG: iron-sulfur cluster-binding protein [Anaerolineae bacterium SM23_84]